MFSANQIKPDAVIVCSKNIQFGTVDHMEGSDTIKLKKDAKGQHHYIPLSWVSSIDDRVHVSRTGEDAMREWTHTIPSPSASQR